MARGEENAAPPLIVRVRSVLARTPGVLRALLHDVSDGDARVNYGPGTWSPAEIVAHLIHAEAEDWLPRVRTMLEHGASRPFEPFDRAGHARYGAGKAIGALLEHFDAARGRSLADLESLALTGADLARAGTHPALGPVTLGNLLATWAAHDLNHVAQMSKALAWRFKDGVGPWEAYLSILAPPSPR